MVAACKRVVDDGHRLPLGGALALEVQRNREWTASLTPAALALRREQVQARGRLQQAGGET